MEDQTSTEYLDEHSRLLGRVVIAVGLLDDDMSDLLAECFALNALQENALVRPLTTRAKAELLVRIAKTYINQKEELKPITGWCERLKAKLDDRNSVIHGAPGHIDGKVHFRSFGGQNRMLGVPEAWPLEKMSELGDRFAELADELQDLKPQFEPFIEGAAKQAIALAAELASPRTRRD